MRILYMGEYGLTCANISFATYDSDEDCLYMSIDDATLSKSEIKIHNISSSVATGILKELFNNGMYDFSMMGLSVEIF